MSKICIFMNKKVPKCHALKWLRVKPTNIAPSPRKAKIPCLLVDKKGKERRKRRKKRREAS